MRVKTLEITWHRREESTQNDPVLSIHFLTDTFFATCGGDNEIKVWSFTLYAMWDNTNSCGSLFLQVTMSMWNTFVVWSSIWRESMLFAGLQMVCPLNFSFIHLGKYLASGSDGIFKCCDHDSNRWTDHRLESEPIRVSKLGRVQIRKVHHQEGFAVFWKTNFWFEVVVIRWMFMTCVGVQTASISAAPALITTLSFGMSLEVWPSSNTTIL